MSRPHGYDPNQPPGKPSGKKRGRPPKYRGPASTLTYTIQTKVVTELRTGATQRMAAALAGTTEGRLQAWLRRGRESIEAGKRSRYTEFVMEVEAALAEYAKSLITAANDAIHDKTMNDKVIRWRLAVGDPKNFTVPRESTVAAGNSLGPLFEMVTPDEARTRLDEKLARFLEENDKLQAAIAEAEREPAPADEASDEKGDDDGR